MNPVSVADDYVTTEFMSWRASIVELIYTYRMKYNANHDRAEGYYH